MQIMHAIMTDQIWVTSLCLMRQNRLLCLALWSVEWPPYYLIIKSINTIIHKGNRIISFLYTHTHILFHSFWYVVLWVKSIIDLNVEVPMMDNSNALQVFWAHGRSWCKEFIAQVVSFTNCYCKYNCFNCVLKFWSTSVRIYSFNLHNNWLIYLYVDFI